MGSQTNSETIASVQESVFNTMGLLQQPVWVFDIDNSRVVWGNSSSIELWQSDSLEELKSRSMAKDMTQTVADRLQQYQNDFLRNPDVQFKELWTIYPNNEPITLQVVYSRFILEDGRMGMMCEALQQSRLDNDAVRSAEALLHTSVMISMYSASGEPLYRNPAAREIIKNTSESLMDHFVGDTATRLLNKSTTEEVKTVAHVNTNKGPQWHDITARHCFDPVSGDKAWLISEVDVSTLKLTEERAQYLADHDTLTGLPNRNFISAGFQNKIDQILSRKHTGALVFIDLDKFKDVNDSLGHDAGDTLLREVARRLTSIQSDSDAVARLGGDEFLCMFAPIKDKQEAETIAERIKKEIAKPIYIHGREIKVTPSIGISFFPENGKNINDLMRHSDLAMYHAKDSGRNEFAFFSNELSDAVQRRINLESELSVALEQEQFVTYFQPRVDTKTNQIVGAEGLVRWEHPTEGLVPPAMFVPVCEASGLIVSLGMYVFAQCVRAQREWAEQGFDIRVSVNLSPLQFNEDSLVPDIIELTEKYSGVADRIELEITESVLLGNDQETVSKMQALVDYGFRIAIDDFGTGYSNLAYLHQYPIDCLKIDRSFITRLDSAGPIVELIVSMAKLFNLDVIAEGVETEEQLKALQKIDCEEYQGFLFERPIDFCAFSNLLQQHQIRMVA